MSRQKKPIIASDKDRKITKSNFNSTIAGANTFDDLINAVRQTKSSLYPNKILPNTENLAIVQNDSDIDPSTQVMVNMIGVSSKAKFLFDLIDNTQKSISNKNELYIPVIGSTDVLKAIARSFPNSSPEHNKIYWNMWVDVVKTKIRQGDVIGSQLLEQLSGNVDQDSTVVNDTIKAGEIIKAEAIINRNNTGNVSGGAGPAPVDYGNLRLASEQSDKTAALLQLLGYGATLVLLYFLNRRLDIYKASESHLLATSSTLYPNPAGIGVMLLQILVGLIIHFMLEGLLTLDAKTVLDNIKIPNVDDKTKADLIVSAKELADGNIASVGPFKGKDINNPDVKSALGFKDGVLQAVKSYFYRADYDLIYEYGLSWLSANANAIHIKGDFTQWLILPELEAITYRLGNNIDEAPNYSRLFKDNADILGDTPKPSLPVSSHIDVEYNQFINTIYTENAKTNEYNKKNSFISNNASLIANRYFEPSQMISSVLENMHSQTCEDNNSIDRLAALLTHDPFIATAVCCFVRYFGQVDLKLLHAMRSIMQIFAKGIVFDLGNFLNTISSNIYDDIFNRSRAGLMAGLNKVFDKLFKDILEWIDAESIEVLEKCLPIDGFLKFTVNSIVELRVSLDKLINDYIKMAEIETYTLDSKISILAEQKWAKTLFVVIDALIKIGADGNNCRLTGDPFNDAPTRALIESLLNQPTRQENALFYNNLVINLQESNLGTGGPTIDGANNLGNTFGTSLTGLNISMIGKYSPRIADKRLEELMKEQTVFNTFLDNEGFVTQNGIKIDSVISNLNNQESYKMTITTATTPENIQSCFESIDQSKLLKHVFGMANG